MLGMFSRKLSRHAPAAPPFVRACNVYCRPASDEAVVAAVFNHGGATAETPGGSVLVTFSALAPLNAAIVMALEACEYQENFNYSDFQETDWPAFRASGRSTVKRFEAEFILVQLRGVNQSNHSYDVTSPAFGAFGMRLVLTVNARSADHARAAQAVVRNYLRFKPLADVSGEHPPTDE